MFSERAEAQALKSKLNGALVKTVTLAIGPEGGWTDEELASARTAGFAEVSLGSLILRTETAVAVCLASVNYALEVDAA